MDLSQYVAALRKRWLLMVALALVGGLGAFGSARATPPTYDSTAKVLVSLSSAATPGELAQGSTYIKNIVESYAALASLPVVLDPVIKDLNLGVSATALSTAISAESPLSTNIIDIQATSTSPQVAAQLANAVAAQLSTTVGELSPAVGTGRQSVSINVVAPATPPNFASAPRTGFLVATGTGAGLALGALLAVLLALLDTRVREARDVDFLGESAAVLASIPTQPRRKHTTVATLVDPLSPRSEAYRRLQTNLSYIDATSPMQIILVTSATVGEGKTSTAINLAISMGETSRRVLLMDVDLRRPAVARLMGFEGAVGLTTVLVGRADIADVIQPLGEMRVDVLAAGEIPPNPHQLIESPAMRQVLEQARERYDTIIIDAPPVLPVSDAAVLSQMADGTLLVVGCKRVRIRDVRSAVRDLTAVGARIAGLVVTFAPESRTSNHYYAEQVGKVSLLTRTLQRRLRPDEDSRRAEVLTRLASQPIESPAVPSGGSTRSATRSQRRRRPKGAHGEVSAAPAPVKGVRAPADADDART